MEPETDFEALKSKLAHMIWMGGSPCAGKSSIADTLVDRWAADFRIVF